MYSAKKMSNLKFWGFVVIGSVLGTLMAHGIIQIVIWMTA